LVRLEKKGLENAVKNIYAADAHRSDGVAMVAIFE
jgi:hypothetical protein